MKKLALTARRDDKWIHFTTNVDDYQKFICEWDPSDLPSPLIEHDLTDQIRRNLCINCEKVVKADAIVETLKQEIKV